MSSRDFADPTDDDHCPDSLRLARMSPEQCYRTWNRARDVLADIPRSGLVLGRDSATARQLLVNYLRG